MHTKVLFYGIISAFIVILWKLGIYYTGNQFEPIGVYSGPLNLVVQFVFIFLTIRFARNELFDGYINFKQCLKVGMQLSLVNALLLTIFIFIFFKYINLEYAEYYIGEVTRAMQTENKTETEIAEQIELLQENVLSPVRQATFALAYTLIAGAFMSFICSTFMVKNRGVS